MQSVTKSSILSSALPVSIWLYPCCDLLSILPISACLVVLALVIVCWIPRISILVRRLHDTGRNGLIVILGLIVPVVIITLNRLVLFGVMESAMHYKVIPVIYECLKALDAVSILALIICVPNIIVMSLLDSKKTNNKWLEK